VSYSAQEVDSDELLAVVTPTGLIGEGISRLL